MIVVYYLVDEVEMDKNKKTGQFLIYIACYLYN